MRPRSCLILLVALVSSACSNAAYPRSAAPFLELVAADDPRALHGEPLAARIGPGMLMEDVAQQMFARAARLGFAAGADANHHVVLDRQLDGSTSSSA